MSKQAEADLVLKLYELRREPVMRQARDWFATEFFPENLADLNSAMFSERSGHLRMVLSYWDMAAALVHHGALSLELFNDTCGEYMIVFARMEPIIGEVRAALGPDFMSKIEKLVDATPGGREKSAMVRERFNEIRAQLQSARQQKVAAQA